MREHTEDRPAPLTLRVLATTDVHMHLTGWDARTNATSPDHGFARLASVIRDARAAAPGPVLLFDNGDSLQGTPHGETARGMSGPHPWATLLDAMNYDAMGLGNHDFDYGLEALATFCAATDVPVLSASAVPALPNMLPHLILERAIPGTAQPLRVGVTSVLPPQTLIWNHAQLTGHLTFRDGVEAAADAVATLRADGADVVVVLCHSGLSDTSAPGAENFARALAAHVPGVDAMILGHTHERFPDAALGHLDGVDASGGTISGVPAAMPGFAGALLAQIDLHLAHQDGTWRVAGHDVRLRDLAQAEPDPEATRLAAPCIAGTRARMQAVVGHTAQGFHNFFGMLHTGTADAVLARAMRDSVAAVVTGTALAHLPLLAATSPYTMGGRAGPEHFVSVAKGPLLERHIAMISPFENTVWAQRMTGADLRAYLETSAQFFGPGPDADTPLVAPAAPAFNFDMLHGLHAQFDPFAPVGARVVSLSRDGTLVDDDASFLVAMTSYRGAGGSGFPGTGGAAAVQTEVSVADALRTYLTAHQIGAQRAPSVWSFATDTKTPVTIETNPRAEAHLDEIAHHAPQPLGLTDAGFLRIRVTL
ncbi:MAG: 5'-nucleotidase C-terminal domain-containing protein [Pseudomonadota bacterium]